MSKDIIGRPRGRATRDFVAASLMSGEYWSIDIPGLTEEDALRIRDATIADAPWGVIVLDPQLTMARGYDRPTVELLAKCLRAGLANGDLDRLDAAGAKAMLEDCESWLSQAE